MFPADVWGTIADWAAAIATIAAVIAALWLAQRSERTRVRVSAVPGWMPNTEGSPHATVFVSNYGYTQFDVLQIVGLWGVFSPRSVLLGHMLADRARLTHGEYSHHDIAWQRFVEFEEHARKHRPFWKLERLLPGSVRVGAVLSTGETVYAPASLVMRQARAMH